MMTSAWLIYSTIALSGFPAQQWTSIQYPTIPICEAQAAGLRAALAKPESIERRKRDEIKVRIEPRCTSQPPQFFVNDGDNR